MERSAGVGVLRGAFTRGASGATQRPLAMRVHLPFEPGFVEGASGPLVHVRLGADGQPVGALAARRLRAAHDRVWQVLTDLDGMATRVPMIQKVQRDGRHVTVHLRFGVSLFSAHFAFKAEPVVEEGRSLELRYVEGEPRELTIRHDLLPARDEGHVVLYTAIGFDVYSVGFLAKFFLKHHPEIRYGVYPGSALALLDSVRRAVER